MGTFTFTISEENQLLVMKPGELKIGSVNDNEVQTLVFGRPNGRGGDNLVLHITTPKRGHRIDLGAENEYIIPNSLTKFTSVYLQAAFIRDGAKTEHSSVCKIQFRPSLEGTAPVPEPMPDTVSELNEGGWFGAAEDKGDYLSVKSRAGKEVAQIPLGGGGGSSTIAWLPTVNAAGDLSWSRSSTTTPPQTRNIKGEDGKDGNDGEPGTDGEAGADGVTFTPAVDDAGNLSWTNSGGLPNPETKNIRGRAGPNQISPDTDVANIPDGKYLGVENGKVVAKNGSDSGSVSIASLKKGVTAALEGSQVRVLDQIQSTVDATFALCEAGNSAVNSGTLKVLGENWLDIRNVVDEITYVGGVVLKKYADGTLSVSHPTGRSEAYRLKITNYSIAPTYSEATATPTTWFDQSLPYSGLGSVYVSMANLEIIGGNSALTANLAVAYSDKTSVAMAQSVTAKTNNGFATKYTDPGKTITNIYLRVIPSGAEPYEIRFKPMVTHMMPQGKVFLPFTSQQDIPLPVLAARGKAEPKTPLTLERNSLVYVEGDKPMRVSLTYDDVKDRWLSSPRFVPKGVPAGGYSIDAAAPFLTSSALLAQTYTSLISDCYEVLRTGNGSYITRESLGLPSSGSTPLYSYRFKPPSVGDEKQQRPAKLPKILIVGGIHGGAERPAYYGLYLFLQQLVTNWKSSPLLEFIRFNVELVVIPRLTTTTTRYNNNGVDINRNFYVNWSADENGGTGPLSEVESQAAYNWLVRESPDADFLLDTHNLVTTNQNLLVIYMGGSDGTNLGLYPIDRERQLIGDGFVRDTYLGFHKANEASFGADYSILNSKTFVGLTNVGAGGTLGRQATAFEVPGFVLESRPLISEIAGALEADQNAQKLAAEYVCNGVLGVCRSLLG